VIYFYKQQKERHPSLATSEAKSICTITTFKYHTLRASEPTGTVVSPVRDALQYIWSGMGSSYKRVARHPVGQTTSVIYEWKIIFNERKMKECLSVKFFIRLVQDNVFWLKCFFTDFSTSSSVTSGIHLETKRALNLFFFQIISGESEFRN
jgi:hypothetical protein